MSQPDSRLESLIDVEQAAALLCMSVSWVRKSVAAGLLPHVRLGRAIRFEVARLRAWAAEQRHDVIE